MIEINQVRGALERAASLLEVRAVNPLRVHAYHRVAEALEGATHDGLSTIDAVVDEVADWPFGEEVKQALDELLEGGELSLLQRLESEPGPREMLQRIPGVGPVLAARLHDRLGVESLWGLERAAADGRLATVAGIAGGKAHVLRERLQQLLAEEARLDPSTIAEPRVPPPVELLLALDTEYRHRAPTGAFEQVTPRRFNARQRAWLPVMRHRYDPWQFTVAYSNSRRAHEQRAIKDWVTIWYTATGPEQQCTVVTSRGTTLRGERVVRGREAECRRLHQSSLPVERPEL